MNNNKNVKADDKYSNVYQIQLHQNSSTIKRSFNNKDAKKFRVNGTFTNIPKVRKLLSTLNSCYKYHTAFRERY